MPGKCFSTRQPACFERPGGIRIFHLALHVLVPLALARFAFPRHWPRAFLIMLATMAVDLDHLLAEPIYDPLRCSIGFHPLHGIVPIGIYLLLCLMPFSRLAGIGLLLHMGLDFLDCLML
ncbi:MAG: DUF6122 family protein [Pseudomonadales bacterium]|nr:DUF6122 family protein [Pseudomonadales bacterium]